LKMWQHCYRSLFWKIVPSVILFQYEKSILRR
jgi:hypothetical protein